jgi:hypothetical protein
MNAFDGNISNESEQPADLSSYGMSETARRIVESTALYKSCAVARQVENERHQVATSTIIRPAP